MLNINAVGELQKKQLPPMDLLVAVLNKNT